MYALLMSDGKYWCGYGQSAYLTDASKRDLGVLNELLRDGLLLHNQVETAPGVGVIRDDWYAATKEWVAAHPDLNWAWDSKPV